MASDSEAGPGSDPANRHGSQNAPMAPRAGDRMAILLIAVLLNRQPVSTLVGPLTREGAKVEGGEA